jgi:glucose-1-phosphate thymidylyltransferase
MIITTPHDHESFRRLLGDGSQFAVSFSYAVQERAEGLAQAFLIGEKFIDNGKSALVLGDNIFHGEGLGTKLARFQNVIGAQIFAYKVKDPERYGVVEFDKTGRAISLEEKPSKPKSEFAVPGLYFYDQQVVDIAKGIKPSSRGELEITSVNLTYLENNLLHVSTLERGTAWLDTGTFESLNSAANFVKIIEERQGLKISCLEEISWRNGWLSDEELERCSKSYGSSPFGKYLRGLIN